MCLNLLGVSTSTVVKPFERGPKVSTFWGSLESDLLFLSQIVVKTVVKRPQLFTTIIDFLERLYGNRVQFVWSGERGSNPRPQLWEIYDRRLLWSIDVHSIWVWPRIVQVSTRLSMPYR